MVMHDLENANVYTNEYGVMYSSSQMVSIAATIGGGKVFLRATPGIGYTGITTYRFSRSQEIPE